jgi:hypothetical protein
LESLPPLASNQKKIHYLQLDVLLWEDQMLQMPIGNMASMNHLSEDFNLQL